MKARPRQPEPFVRGAPYPPTAEVPYPRADPADIRRLPADVWHAACVPVGVRLQMVGDAEAVDVAYRTTTGNLGYRGDGAGVTFSVWRAGRQVCEADAELGDGLIRLRLAPTTPHRPATVYLPEGMLPVVRSLTAVHGEIAPAPPEPRWLAYGDTITQGWIASGPAQAWAAIAARKAGLDIVNMGYAQSGRGEMASAEQMAALDADVISISYGASCWTRLPHTIAMVESGLDAFLEVVRQGHPDTPVIVMSPVFRPDGEEPNRLGTTLVDIRGAIESVTRRRIREGDENLALLAGASIIGERYLGDGLYPGDEGHKRIAAAMGKYLLAAMRGSLHDLAAAALDHEDDAVGSVISRDRVVTGNGSGSGNRNRGRGRNQRDRETADEDPTPVRAVENGSSTKSSRTRAGRPTADRPVHRRPARAPAV